MNPVEVSTTYATVVPDLAAAWAFVMEHLDSVGPDPSVRISPLWKVGDPEAMARREPDAMGRHFEVSVSGMVEQ